MLIFDDKLIYMDFFYQWRRYRACRLYNAGGREPQGLKRAALKYFQSKAVACFVACYVLEGEHSAD